MNAPEQKDQPPGGFLRLEQNVADFFHRLGRAWTLLLKWYYLLQSARACLLTSLLVPVVFVGVDQGQDTLRQLASQGVSWQALWMCAGMWVAGLASWAWARFLLDCEFPASAEARDLPEAAVDRARRAVRRLCGLLPPIGTGVGFLFAADNSGTIRQCLLLAAVCFGLALALWFSFEPLSQWHTRSRAGSHPTDGRRYRYASLVDIRSDPFAKWAIVATWLVCALIFVGVTNWPVVFGELLGSPAVLLFAAAVWVSVGSVFMYAASVYRVPLFTLLLVWAVFCSFFNDNHAVRTLPAAPGLGNRPTLVRALDQWYTNVSAAYPLTNGAAKRPVYMVASAGGGIRAAYWTASVLGHLEDCARSNGTSFAAHTFLLSGVSGGSLGEITFVGLLAHPLHGQTSFTGSARRLLGRDFLAADLAKMVFADLLQLFLPFPVTAFDRAQGLEDAWAAPWRREAHFAVLDRSVEELYDDANRSHLLVPHLLLNGTCVETGQRIITSDLAIRSRVKAAGRPESNGNFLDVLVAADKLTNATLRLSTAAHQSARFTYFSPAGRFPDGTHIVDGGYFENSGAATLMDAVRAVQWRIQTNRWTDVEPRLILIANEPIPLPSNGTNRLSRLSRELFGRFLHETLSPIRALLNTRGARGAYAAEQALDYNWTGRNIYQFNLYERKEDQPLGACAEPAGLPLGWTLPRCAMDEMDAQLTLPFDRATNSVTISKILAALPRKRTQP